MRTQAKAISVAFDIDALGGGFYGSKAWRIFLNRVEGIRIAGCSLLHGDTSATLHGRAREHCIAISGEHLDTDYIRRTFSDPTLDGLCPPERRFIEQPQLAQEPLMVAGRVDASGRFAESEWSRMFHDRCKDTGWGYKPGTTPGNLSADLRAELEDMMKDPGT